MVTFVTILLLFNLSRTYSQSDTSFVGSIIESQGQSVTNESKTKTLKSINNAFHIFLHQKNWDKIYKCGLCFYYLHQNNFISCDESAILLESQSNKLPKDKNELLGKYYHLIFVILRSCGKIHNSLYYAEKALIKYKLESDSTIRSKLFNGLCVANIQLRDFKQAVAYGKQAVNFATLKDKFNKSIGLENLGLAYLYNGNGFLGRTYLEKAKEIYYTPDITNYYKWISESYQAEGDNVCAMIYADSSMQYAINTKSENLPFALIRKGEIYQSDKKFALAITFFKKALLNLDSRNDPRELAKILLPLAQSELQMGQLKEAEKIIDQGIFLIGPNIAKLNAAKNENIPIGMADMYYLDFLYEKSLAKWLLYQKTKNKGYLDESDHHLMLCTQFTSQMKLFFGNYSAKRHLSLESKKVYSLMLEVQYEKYRLTKEEKIKENIFTLSQEYNSFTLREQMNEKYALHTSVNNQKLIDRYYKLKRNYLDAIEGAWTDSLQQDMFTVQQWKKDFLSYSDSLQRSFPKFKQFKSGIPILSSSDISKNLNNNEAFISYYLSDTSIYAFTIIRGKYELIKSRISSSDFADLNNYLTTISQPISQTSFIKQSSETITQKGHAIYNKLFNGIKLDQSIKSLVIVPDGVLYRLPFEALVVKPKTNQRPKDQYLVLDYDIRYLYFVAQLTDKTTIPSNADILALGLEYDTFTLESMKDFKKEEVPDWIKTEFRSESMAQLLFADDEAKKVVDIYGGKAFVNQDALPENLFRNIKQYNMVHISAHSFADYVSPDESAIILTKKDINHNNLLTAEHIESLNIRSRLVTLSSCNSSSGMISLGEGVSSLTKSFFSAGCESVIGSHWSVSDQVTSILMERFYMHLKTGMTKSKALSQAKIDLMDDNLKLVNPAYRHPTYWAPWTLYGSDDPIVEIPKSPYYLLIGILVLCILMVTFLTKANIKYHN